MKRLVSGVRVAMGVAVLAGVLAGGWGRTPEARAAVASRGDPIFLISGTSGGVAVSYGIQIGISASTTSTQVQHVTYALDGPVGTAVKLEFAPDDALSGKESYTYTADRTNQQVAAVITVTTAAGSVPVTVNESAVQIGAGLAFTAPFQVSGMSNQPITTFIGGSLYKPLVSWGS